MSENKGVRPRRPRLYERNLVLIGFMGSGKSTIGRICARRLRATFHDTDAAICERTGITVAEIFATRGEMAFRELEREIVAELAGGIDMVIATGGGAIMSEINVECLRRSGRVVLLNATPEILLKRVGGGRGRPLLAGASDPAARIEEMLSERMPTYERVADYVVTTDDRPAPAVADEVVRWFRRQERLT